MAYKHGMDGTKIYRVWGRMKERCNNPHNSSYHSYGGRGIKVCDEWNDSFIPFYEWALANGYEDGLTLDRENVNGGYNPENCRWITNLEQQRNKRNNHFVTINGETKTISEWSEISGVPPKTLRHRIISNWKEEDLLNNVYKAKDVEINGVHKSLTEWAKDYNLPVTTLHSRHRAGIRGEELIVPIKDRRVRTIVRGENLTIDEIWNKYKDQMGIKNKTALTSRYNQGLRGEELIKPTKTIMVTINGETKSINQWSETSGVSHHVIKQRYDKGITGEALLEMPKRKLLEIEINGETKSARQWALNAGISHNVLLKRYKEGIRGEELLAPTKSKVHAYKIEINGIKDSFTGWERRTGIDRKKIKQRYDEGLRGEALISPTTSDNSEQLGFPF